MPAESGVDLKGVKRLFNSGQENKPGVGEAVFLFCVSSCTSQRRTGVSHPAEPWEKGDLQCIWCQGNKTWILNTIEPKDRQREREREREIGRKRERMREGMAKTVRGRR